VRYIVLEDGNVRRLLWGCDDSGRYLARDYYEALDPHEQTQFQPQFSRMAATGQIANRERYFRVSAALCGFAAGEHRIVAVDCGRDLVLIHGFSVEDGSASRNWELAAEIAARFSKSD
jgi:hypothetical protein